MKALMLIFVVAALIISGCSSEVRQRGTVRRVATTRDVERAAIRESLRVATVGDSLAYGASDESDRGIAGRIDTELRAMGVRLVATENLGKNGATKRDEGSRGADSC